MTQAVEFPRSLPKPQVATIKAAERRAKTPTPAAGTTGAYEVRTQQRDYLATQQVVFTFTAAQTDIFEEWWVDEVYRGGAWFAAVWPLPEGLITGVRRFVAEPDRSFLPARDGGIWRISGICEVRGRGELPQTPEELTVYTSWPYPIFVEEAFDALSSQPRSGLLWIPPHEFFDADHALPQSGLLDTILHTYSQPPEELSADHAEPQSGTLPTVLVTYEPPPEELNADHALPVSGTLPLVLIRYHPPADEFGADHAIPQAGSLA